MRITLFVVLLASALAGCGRPQPTTVRKKEPAPPLEGAFTWLNTPAIQLSALRGKVLLLHFFDYASADSVRDLPVIKQWQQRYDTNTFVVLGIHTPERDFALDPINVSAGVKRLGITYPVAVDSDQKIAAAYNKRAGTCFVLLDKEGGLRFERVGPGQYAETEATIQLLLREISPSASWPAPMANPLSVPGKITPMLYLGTVCGPLGNEPSSATNGISTYALPATLEVDQVYVTGQWSRHESYLRHAVDVPEMTDALVVRYHGVDVSVVMKPEDVYWKQVLVQQDGRWLDRAVAGKDVSYDEQGRSFVRVNMAALYEIVGRQSSGPHELKLFSQGKGLSVYSFHFGDRNPR